MRICAVVGCSSKTYQLQKWRRGFRSTHNCYRASQECTCPELFKLHLFPTLKGDPARRKEWIESINQKNPKTGKNWQPSEDDRVCSRNFVDGKPTVDHASMHVPLSKWGATTSRKNIRQEQPGKREVYRSLCNTAL